MKFAQVAELPEFDTGQYEGCEFVMSGDDATLTIRLAELPDFEIIFYRVRCHQFTALPNCDPAIVKNAYFRLVEGVESPALSSFIESDLSPRRAYRELHHYQIFLDETGCHETFAESASARSLPDLS